MGQGKVSPCFRRIIDGAEGIKRRQYLSDTQWARTLLRRFDVPHRLCHEFIAVAFSVLTALPSSVWIPLAVWMPFNIQV